MYLYIPISHTSRNNNTQDNHSKPALKTKPLAILMKPCFRQITTSATYHLRFTDRMLFLMSVSKQMLLYLLQQWLNHVHEFTKLTLPYKNNTRLTALC